LATSLEPQRISPRSHSVSLGRFRLSDGHQTDTQALVPARGDSGSDHLPHP
jgi:hypothetical protein